MRDKDPGLFFSSSLLASFHSKYSIQNSVDTQRVFYKQDMDPGPAKILYEPEKGDTENAVALWKGRYGGKTHWEKLAKNIKIICFQKPIWKGSCRRSFIWCLLRSFNGKWQGFAMVCSESELRLVYISLLNKISSKGHWIGSTCMSRSLRK